MSVFAAPTEVYECLCLTDHPTEASLAAEAYGGRLESRTLASWTDLHTRARVLRRWEEHQCPVCLSEDEPGYLLLGCCTAVLCYACLSQLSRCPVCRAPPGEVAYLATGGLPHRQTVLRDLLARIRTQVSCPAVWVHGVTETPGGGPVVGYSAIGEVPITPTITLRPVLDGRPEVTHLIMAADLDPEERVRVEAALCPSPTGMTVYYLSATRQTEAPLLPTEELPITDHSSQPRYSLPLLDDYLRQLVSRVGQLRDEDLVPPGTTAGVLRIWGRQCRNEGWARTPLGEGVERVEAEEGSWVIAVLDEVAAWLDLPHTAWVSEPTGTPLPALLDDTWADLGATDTE